MSFCFSSVDVCITFPPCMYHCCTQYTVFWCGYVSLLKSPNNTTLGLNDFGRRPDIASWMTMLWLSSLCSEESKLILINAQQREGAPLNVWFCILFLNMSHFHLWQESELTCLCSSGWGRPTHASDTLKNTPRRRGVWTTSGWNVFMSVA